jgi:hypothetical protein
MKVILLVVWGIKRMWQKYLRGGRSEKVTDFEGA